MKKLLKSLAIMALACILAAGCGKTVEAPETTQKATTEETTTTVETTTADPYEGLVVNPLTGVRDYPEESEGNRPVCVMVNNVTASLPQYGIADADIIFEIPVEGYLTRLLCVYSDYENVPYIVSVRSYRYYFAAISCGFDAIYIHWGQDNTMMSYYYSLDMDSYNGMSNKYMFGRDQSRKSAGYATEHTSYFDGSLLASQMEEDGVRTELEEEYEGTVFNFNSEDEAVLYGDEEAYTVDIKFGGTSAKLVYDEETQTYLKYTAGKEQTDGSTGEQISFTNVIILETKIWTRDEKGHLGMNITGVSGNAGYYITAGGAQPITWDKEDEDSQFVFYDEDGNELELNCGKTYIAITRSGKYSFEGAQEEEE